MDIILFGAGTTGRYILRDLRARGTPPVAFADNNFEKQGTKEEGLIVLSPENAKALYPDAIWVASAIRPELREEITEQLYLMGVQTVPVWDFLPKRYATSPPRAQQTLESLAGDRATISEFRDQMEFRKHPSERQAPPSDDREIYFPDFIIRREDEHFVDCGAADGDTVQDFLKRYPKYAFITALEPDPQQFLKLKNSTAAVNNIRLIEKAVTDHCMGVTFDPLGDESAHVVTGHQSEGADGSIFVKSCCLDNLDYPVGLVSPPTFIKMDIEGAEPEALWGAREIIKKYSPVLAICAYHEAEHFWTLPLLIHALNPEYKLFVRRYAYGTFETVWYAVPPSRVNGCSCKPS